MQILLNQEEITVAIQDFIRKVGITCPVDDVSFTVTRSPAGVTAQVDINAVVRSGTRPTLVKPEAEEDDTDTPDAVEVPAEAVVDTVAEEPEEAFAAADDEPPFDTEEEEAVTAKSNSLFG